jgi:hypothetical protein
MLTILFIHSPKLRRDSKGQVSGKPHTVAVLLYYFKAMQHKDSLPRPIRFFLFAAFSFFSFSSLVLGICSNVHRA